jgi:uncharacterized membrane protein YgdD (TMEM256/DUF423 family)
VKDRHILFVGGVLGGLGVALGAFGAHWLEGAIKQWGLEPVEELKRLNTWEVAVRYQMYHALALLALGALATRLPERSKVWSARLFIVGTCVFSGCLYVLVLSGVKVLGAVVPLGGSCLIGGWLVLAIAALRCSDSHC